MKEETSRSFNTQEDAKKHINEILEEDDFDSIELANLIDIAAVIFVEGYDCEVAISKACGYGSDRYYPIEGEERWQRCALRRVTIKVRRLIGEAFKETDRKEWVVVPGTTTFRVNSDGKLE